MSQGEEPALQFTDIRKSYGRSDALSGLSFDVHRSEFVALLGPNGAGKSTLFQIAAGLFNPDDGEVKLFGLRYGRDSSRILSRLGVVFQARSLDLEMTVRSNLRFHGALFGLSGRLLRDRIQEVTGLLDIRDLLEKRVRTLSGGNQRRVEIARALINSPDLLLMDEPSVGLDPGTREMLMGHIQAIRAAKGTSILWATHLVDEVETADRVVLMKNGTVVQSGTPKALKAAAGAASLTEAYIALTGVPLQLEGHVAA